MREEVYNWGSFAQSRMHAQGVTCSDCHDPHSLKLRAPGNAVCAQCHQPAKFDALSHAHHAAGTPGAACTSCHMPTTNYMVVDARHDHSLRIPRPDLSVKLGVPNPCNACHRKETPQWAADAIAKWNGKAPTGYQQFAAAFDAGSAGGPGARGALLALIDDPSQPAIVRASALARLVHLMTPTMLPAVSRALNDPDAVVRLAAVEALAGTDPVTRQRYLARMLADPVRAVRIEAARALAGPAETGLAAEDRARFDRALADLVAVQTYNADRPEGRLGLANLYAARGNAEGAIAEYRKALALDPSFVPAYANLADLYRARGVDNEAESVLRAGIARVPGAAALHHSLGLVMVRQKRTPDALKELAEATRLDPANARFAYVYAVALNDAGDPGRALEVLPAALGRQPYDRDLLSGLALYSARAGQREAAIGYAKKLVALDPESPEHAQLAARIEGRPVN
jgi:predicted CXXCH cytochrome family protein